MKYPNGSESILSAGPFSQLMAVRNCPCSDGKTRTARITGIPDSAFSIPARVTVCGKTVTGFVMVRSGENEGFWFVQNQFGKNADSLPQWDWR